MILGVSMLYYTKMMIGTLIKFLQGAQTFTAPQFARKMKGLRRRSLQGQ